MVSAVDRVVVANGVRNITICKNTPHVGKPVYSCVRESLPSRGVFRGGMGGIRPPLSYYRPPLNFQILKKINLCMMYNSLFTII